MNEQLSDVEASIECWTQCIVLAPDGDPQKPDYLANAGLCHLRRYDRLGELVDLDCAVFVGGRGQLGPKGYAKVRMAIVDHVVYSLSRARL